MKLGIVENGFVGATAGYALVMQGVGREVVLVDNNICIAHGSYSKVQPASAHRGRLARSRRFPGRKAFHQLPQKGTQSTKAVAQRRSS
jgi:malate/lactate dehydrogenase